MNLPASVQVLERGWLSSNNILLFEPDGESATLVDSGYVGHAAQTLALVKSALAARRPQAKLTRLINTHSHSDHLGGNATLKNATGCAIHIPAGIERMVAEWDAEALLLEPARQRADRFAHDAIIQPGQALEMGGLVWQGLPAPGHDMEALVFYCSEQRLLISGDALWQDGFGIVFGELMGKEGALAATRATLEMLARLPVDCVIPGHGAPFDDIDAAFERAFARLASFEADGGKLARNAVRACFTFNLLDLTRLAEDALPTYLQSVPFFAGVNRSVFKLADEDFASWLLGDLLRAHVVEVRNGWIIPRMAP